VFATDTAGNQASDFTEEFTIDTVKPSVTIDATIPSLTNTFPTSLSGTAEPDAFIEAFIDLLDVPDPSTGEPFTEVFVDFTTADSITGLWTVPVPLITPTPVDGDYLAGADAFDLAGNVGLTEDITFTFDATPPSVTIDPIIPSLTKVFPTSLSGTAEPDAFIVAFIDLDVPDPETGESFTEVFFDTTTADSITGIWTVPVPLITPTPVDGDYIAGADAFDLADNVGETEDITFTFDTTAPLAPVITNPLEASVVTTATPTISGSAEPFSSIIISDETFTTIGSTTTDELGFWTTPSLTLSEGPHFITATATDAVQNISPESIVVTFTVDTIQDPPVASAFAPDNVVEQAIVPLVSFSFDLDNDSLTFLWTQTSGIPVTISDAVAEETTFTAPTVTTPQVLEFNLLVTDSTGLIDNESVIVTVHDTPSPPTLSTLYGTDANGGNLLTIDTATGIPLSSNFMDALSPIPSLAIDPKEQLMYAGGGQGTPFVYVVVPETGLALFLGDSGLGFASIGGMDFNSAGTLFAAVNIAGNGGTGSDHLATIDTSTGTATITGPFGTCSPDVLVPTDGFGSCSIEGMEGIAFAADGTLWGSHSERGAAGLPGLYTIDTNTGAATFVSDILDSVSNPTSGGVVSLQFVEGTLFGGTARAQGGASDGGSLITIEIITIDTTTTAEFTTVGSTTSSGSSLGSLAFLKVSELDSPTGSGPVTTSPPSLGTFTALEAVSENTIQALNKPENVEFPHGLLSFAVGGLSTTTPDTIDILIEYPENIAVGSQYFKVISGVWVDATSALGISANDGDEFITLTILDNGPFDTDPILGQISDPGGIVEPTLVAAPEIVSLIAGGESLGFTDGDTITVTFSEPTNRPLASTKADLDNLFTFSQSLGTDYVGTWTSDSSLVITILDTGGITGLTGLTLTVNPGGNLKNKAETSLASTDTSPSLTGSFGVNEAPFVTSITAADPDGQTPGEASGFTDGDTITLRFSEATNGLTLPVSTTADLANLFTFSQSLGTISGDFVNSRTLVITIVDASGAEVTNASIGVLTVIIRDNLVQLRDEANSSAPSSGLQTPTLSGTFGIKEGPSITALVVDDPDNDDAVFGAGDTITVSFAEDTNTPTASTKADIDNLFAYTQILGADYTGFFIDPATLVITIVDTTDSEIDAQSIGTFRLQVNFGADLKDADNTSKASTALSPPLTGTFGNKPGPFITSIVASDPNDPVVPGFSDGDTITVTFSEPTNRPLASTKADIDDLFRFEQSSSLASLGADYVGTWTSVSTLVITIIDSTGATPPAVTPPGPAFTMKVEVDGVNDLRNQVGTSLPSDSESPALVGDFGVKAGPSITSITAADPDGADAVFGNDDTITVRFSEATNEPFKGTANQLSKANLDDLFIFSQSIGDDYSGEWLNALTLEITIVDSENLESPPVIGELTITVRDDVVQLRDEANSSTASTSVSPPLAGTFGNKAGPFITSLVALDPFANTLDFGDGDTITVTFSDATNEPFKGVDNQVTQADVDRLFTFSISPLELADAYTGEWFNPLTFVITIDTAGSSTVTDANSIGSFSLQVNSGANLKGVDVNGNANTLASIAASPALEGSFKTRAGPSIVSITAADPNDPVVPGFSNFDTITVKFSEATNEPAVETQANIDALFTFSPALLGAVLKGKFIDPETLILNVTNSGTTDPQPGEFTITVKQSGNLRSGTETSAASTSTSPVLDGNFGQKTGPLIRAIVADDPNNSDSIFSNGDTITVKFSEPTN